MRATPLLCAILAAALTGCGDKPQPEPAPKPTTTVEAPKPKKYRRPRLSTHALTETLYYPLKTCVVSGKKLTLACHNEEIDGRLVRLYNQTYVDAFKQDKAKYWAKLDQAYKDQQRDGYLAVVKTCPITDAVLEPGKSFEVLLDPREDYVQVLDRNMRYLKFRYTIAWRLVILKDEAAFEKFKAVEDQVYNAAKGKTRKRAPHGEKAMKTIVETFIKAQREQYLEQHRNGQHVNCVVNMRPLGRVQEDPETGGYRHYLLHDKLMIVCCKSCMQDIRMTFKFQLRGMAWVTGQREEEVSILDQKKLPPPPEG